MVFEGSSNQNNVIYITFWSCETRQPRKIHCFPLPTAPWSSLGPSGGPPEPLCDLPAASLGTPLGSPGGLGSFPGALLAASGSQKQPGDHPGKIPGGPLADPKGARHGRRRGDKTRGDKRRPCTRLSWQSRKPHSTRPTFLTTPVDPSSFTKVRTQLC